MKDSVENEKGRMFGCGLFPVFEVRRISG